LGRENEMARFSGGRKDSSVIVYADRELRVRAEMVALTERCSLAEVGRRALEAYLDRLGVGKESDDAGT
jgi:hypothetical protein